MSDVAQLTTLTADGSGLTNGNGTVTVGQKVFLRTNLIGITSIKDPEKITLTLTSGGRATYDVALSSENQFVFSYTVGVDQISSDLEVASINLNGASLLDKDDQPAYLWNVLLDIPGVLKVNGHIGTSANETFNGTSGDDKFEGKGGDDTYYINSAGDQVVEIENEGYDSVISYISYAIGAENNIEHLALSESTIGNFNLTGSNTSNYILGNNGNNTLSGRGGADIMEGLGGDDIYGVDNAADRVIESIGGGYDQVITSSSFSLTDGQEIELIRINNGNQKDINLTGNEFSNRMIGNMGSNTLSGRGGADRMEGRGGDDTYGVDNRADKIFESKNGGYDRVISTVSYKLNLGQEIELVRFASKAKGDLNLTGNEFAQHLIGNVGNNVIDGGYGNDVLTGGDGKDTFLFSTHFTPQFPSNIDHITDFSTVDDVIHLSSFPFALVGDLGDLPSYKFKNITTGTLDSNDRILYKQETGELFYDQDGSGHRAAKLFAIIDNKADLTHADFVLV